MTPPRDWTDWADALYLGALSRWPHLTPEQFTDAANTWAVRQQAGMLGIVEVVRGVEAELRARYGDPTEKGTDPEPSP